jgi:D-alanyl-D-alanine carboxypeptidase (penicillin-binding protein 5/6)
VSSRGRAFRGRLAAARASALAPPRLRGALVGLIALVAAAAVPAGASALTPPPLNVSAADLIEMSSGQQLFGTNENSELPIASTTKMMTALVTLQHVQHLGQIFVAPDYYAASSDSQIGLVPGEQMSVHDLMLALMLPSADDAAEDLAYNVGHGSVARFVGMMNANARALGLDHTHYATPIGLDTPGNYSSASDLVKLASYELQNNRFFAHIVSLPSATLDTGPVHYVVNRNDLVAKYSWIKGVKTGHTSGAGYVLVAAGEQHGMTLLSAVLGTDSEAARDSNTLALLDWGFANFHIVSPLSAGEQLAAPLVKDRPGVHASVIAAAGFRRVLQNGTRVTLRVRVPHQLAGPLKRHAVVGYVLVRAGGRTLDRVPLLLAQRLTAVSSLTLAARAIMRPFTLLIVLVLLGLAAGLVARRRGRAHTRGGIQLR